MVKISPAPFLVVLPLVAAFPGAMESNKMMHEARGMTRGMADDRGKNYVYPKYRAPKHLIQRPNTGFPTHIFDAEKQLVPTTGKHRFIAPGPGDRRGQCAGLNAAANHGYISRDGIADITSTVKGLADAYGMGVDVSGFLAVLSIALEGDPLIERWSIGGPIQTGIDGPSGGLYGTHNKYENDGSIMMGDAYLNGGRVAIFQKHSLDHWMPLADMFGSKDDFTFNQAAAQTDWVQRFGILNNPYFFSGPFSGVVSPAAHNLVIELMSNHSAEKPSGFLTRDVWKSWFAITGDKGNYKYTAGHERIPDNWYRRPLVTQNNLAEIGIDLVQNNAAYPGILRFGGNTGKVDSFVGVSISDFTAGQYGSVEDLAKGNNGACFLLQASLGGIPDVANPLLSKAGTLLGFVLEKFEPLRKKYGCAELSMFDNSFFNAFPGANYTPRGY